MVTYTYSISPSGPTSNIQEAINNIASELATNPVIDRDIDVLVGRGNYAGFTIPTGALFSLLGTPFRLNIKAAGDFFPIVDFNFSNETQIVGIDVGSGNPNVTIKNIRVQYFAIGIRAALNSHYPIVRNCITNNNRNVGILFEQASESQAIQNVVINGDYGIVSRLCKSSAIVHNTIFQNGAISTVVGKSKSCVWAELANDYGGGLDDTGTLHLIGNVAWNTSGRCLTLFATNLELPGAIVSNYNDWVVGDPEDFIAIEDNAFFFGPAAIPRQTFTNLLSWKVTGLDANSISQDPKFIAPIKIRTGKNGFAIDLNLLPVSPVLGIVPSFPFNAAATQEWLPTYLDTSHISTDLLRNNRNQSGTAAGSNEKVSTSGFFGQDVFSNPLDLGLAKECGIDPFSNILFKTLDLWYPKLNKGYFYSNEREFYLYSKKETKSMGELAKTTLYLPAAVAHSRPIEVRVAGKKVTQLYFDLVKDQLIIYHRDLPISTGEEEVEISGSIANWNGDSFVYSSVLYRLKINEGETQYLLPETYVNSGPVVVTDDLSYPTDSDTTSNREFAVGFDPYSSRSEVILANDTNLITNGQFDYSTTGDVPSFWDSQLCDVRDSIEPHFSVAGSKVASLQDQGFIRTTLPVSTGEDYSFSFHARSEGSGDISWEIEFYDASHNILGVVLTGAVPATDSWQRYSIGFGTSGEDFDITVPQVPYPCQWITGYNAPTRSYLMTLKLRHDYSPSFTGELLLDAVQYEKTSNTSLYHRRPYFHEMTVEYETSEDDYFIDSDLSMAPVTNLISDGFLYIPEIAAAHYGGPYTPAVTTLHEWRWPDGRKNVMPWARTKGKDKLRKRPLGLFNHIPDPKPEIISPVSNYSTAKDIVVTPSTPTTFVGDTNGIGITIRVKDEHGNPFARGLVNASLVDFNLRYPGTLSKRLYGLKEMLGASVNAATDNAGVVALTWIPPDRNAGVYRGPLPSPSLTSTSGDRVSVIKTEYPISLESYGNVTILDNVGSQIKTHADLPTVEVHEPALGPDSSQITLKYPAKIGSIVVIVDGEKYIENQTNILNSNQFFVDYDNSLVTVKGRAPNIYVEYLASYVFVSQVDPYKIMLYHDKIFPTYTNNIVLGYDFSIKLDVKVDNPGKLNVVQKDFLLIAQNSLSQQSNTYSPISFEF
tara:strand:+ start:108205 stop:111687 length:3483 start_codon:yes stop_codon:yes gene_type:complete